MERYRCENINPNEQQQRHQNSAWSAMVRNYNLYTNMEVASYHCPNLS